MTSLGALNGGTSSIGYAVSEDGGVVVGESEVDDPNSNLFADGDSIAKSFSDGIASHAFLWSSNQGMVDLGDLPGGANYSSAFAVSATGTVVAGVAGASLGPEAFRWTTATGMVGLGDLPGGAFSSEALAITADGNIVVGRSQGYDGETAFYWDSTGGMRTLAGFLKLRGAELPGWTLQAATGISSNGRVISGYGLNPGGEVSSFTATIAPEPTSIASAATGVFLIGVLGLRRKLKSKHSSGI
jgi:probable HAF family extracellular repeat protein